MTRPDLTLPPSDQSPRVGVHRRRHNDRPPDRLELVRTMRQRAGEFDVKG
jgi:hypothetical protein